jgi:hypothetical protein
MDFGRYVIVKSIEMTVLWQEKIDLPGQIGLNNQPFPTGSICRFRSVFDLKPQDRRRSMLRVPISRVIWLPALLVIGIAGEAFGQSLSLTVDPTAQQVNAGQAATYTVGINRVGSNKPVTLSVINLPAGTTAAFSPNPSSLATSTLTITTLATTLTGTYSNIAVRGDMAGVVALPVAASLTVLPKATSSVNLSVTPSSRTITYGQSTTYTVNLNRNNYAQKVTLSAQNLPVGTTASFNPASPTGNTSTLTVTSSATGSGWMTRDIEVHGVASGIKISPALASLRVTKDISWMLQWGGADHDHLRGLGSDSAGNVYVGGVTVPQGQPACAVTSSWIRKYSVTGAFQWSRSFNDFNNSSMPCHGSRFRDMAVAPNGDIFLLGHNEHEFPFLIKYSTLGNRIWLQDPVIESDSPGATGYTVTIHGLSIFLTGRNRDFVIIEERDPFGARVRSAESIFVPYSLAPVAGLPIDASGNLYIGTVKDLVFGPAIVGKVAMTPVPFPDPPPDLDWNYAWQQTLTNSDPCMSSTETQLNDISVDSVSRLFAAATSSCTWNNWNKGELFSFESNGTPRPRIAWGRSMDGVVVDPNLIPYFIGVSDLGFAALGRFDSNIRTSHFDGPGNEDVRFITIGGASSIFVAGTTTGVMTGNNQGGRDVWIAKVETGVIE